LDFVSHFWWLVFPLAGVVGGWGRAWSQANERRHRRRMEMYKLRHPQGLPAPLPAPAPDVVTAGEAEALVASHDATNKLWLSYELDVGKLIDFPMMTDVREPLTVAFLRAKRTADAMRPAKPTDITSRSRLEDYRNAVTSYEVAFEVAEREAKRIKDSAFTEPERVRLGTARKLVNIAENDAASPAERQTAYKRARRELDGLIVLPDVTIAALEEKVAGMIDRPQQGS
jgi:hypothetical protein